MKSGASSLKLAGGTLKKTKQEVQKTTRTFKEGLTAAVIDEPEEENHTGQAKRRNQKLISSRKLEYTFGGKNIRHEQKAFRKKDSKEGIIPVHPAEETYWRSSSSIRHQGTFSGTGEIRTPLKYNPVSESSVSSAAPNNPARSGGRVAGRNHINGTMTAAGKVRKGSKSAAGTASGVFVKGGSAAAGAASGAATAGISTAALAATSAAKKAAKRSADKARELAEIAAVRNHPSGMGNSFFRTKQTKNAKVQRDEKKISGSGGTLLVILTLPVLFLFLFFAIVLLPASLYTKNSGTDSVEGKRIVAAAKEELSNSALNVGGTKYKAWYGMDANWCAMFVSWCANECGYIDSGIMPKTASVANMKSWYESQNLYHTKESGYEPVPGDVIIFLNGRSHTGLVVDYDSTSKIITTIEGNTGTSAASPYHKGSQVKERRYPLTYLSISGYGSPQYETEESTE